ncbi:hypothetical protein [Fusobacterium pseudoperiodonticum]|uniref:hypothetical protein n=1 Tax=Fusobacterium pseudoperiodonticum TaxID=2663009 RepID=UPI00129354E8|nr:hypothetical protein [Fusobacterium pseudoperiodonticum]
MIYRCKNCNKFIANIKNEKNMKIKCKSVEYLNKNTLKIKCSCKHINIVEIQKVK